MTSHRYKAYLFYPWCDLPTNFTLGVIYLPSLLLVWCTYLFYPWYDIPTYFTLGMIYLPILPLVWCIYLFYLWCDVFIYLPLVWCTYLYTFGGMYLPILPLVWWIKTRITRPNTIRLWPMIAAIGDRRAKYKMVVGSVHL